MAPHLTPRISSRRRIAALVAALLVAASLIGAPSATAATLWVVGGDAAAGCSGSRCRSLRDALDRARSGDVIELTDGGQVNAVVDVAGVTVRRAPGSSAVLKGATQVTADQVTLRDLRVEGALFVKPSAADVVIERLTASDVFVKIDGAGPVTIRDSVIDGAFDEDAMQIVNGAHNVLVERTTISGATLSSTSLKQPVADRPHADCVQMFGGGRNITFRRNYIGECDMSAFMIKSDRGALRNVVFERNFIQDCWPARAGCDALYAIHVSAGSDVPWDQRQPTDPDAYYPLTGLVFRQNTIDGGVILVNQFIGQTRFVGNVVTGGHNNANPVSGRCGPHVFDQNVFSATVGCDGFSLAGNRTGAVKFVDGESGDLHLAAGSAGLETGSTHAAAAGVDIDGDALCGKADAGADESCAAGAPAKGPRFTDIAGNVHEPMILAIAERGITSGCSSDGRRYCPAVRVTRAQMASFLARALALPAAARDHFADDEGSPHEDAINRVASAGITAGYPDGTYRPDREITRAEMASLLTRAFHLRASSLQPFRDVTGVHASAIGAIAAAGVTKGCTADGTAFCPDDLVPRDQMASFIGRAMGLRP